MKEGRQMDREEFYTYLDKIFKDYKRPMLVRVIDLNSHYGKNIIQKLNDYIMTHYDCDDIQIQVFSYEIKKNKVLLKTELGTFLLDDRYKESSRGKEVLDTRFTNTKYPLLEFFGMLFYNNTNYQVNNNHGLISYRTVLEDYLKAYFTYRMITDPNEAKRLFLNFSIGRYGSELKNDKSIPLEYLDNRDYNNYRYMNKDYAFLLQEIYENFYQFDNNYYLVFSMIVLLNLTDKLSYVTTNFSKFKTFIFDKTERNNNNPMLDVCYDFIKENDLLKEFTEEELKKLYMLNPDFYFAKDRELFSKIASSIKNTSVMVRLNEERQAIHLRYYDYDLYEGSPAVERKIYKDKKNKKFLDYFFYCNETVVKLYKFYYKGYRQTISGHPNKDNLEDFIKSILQPVNLINIYNSVNFDWEDLRNLSRFGEYYGKEQQKQMRSVEEYSRKHSLLIHNSIVKAQENKQELDACLEKFHLSPDTIYHYIINNKFLFAKEKEALLKICEIYYSDGLKVLDVFLLLDEMITRELTLEEILREKEIPLKEFYQIYNRAKENNPILYQYIFESLSKSRRRGYLKLLRLGYKVLLSNVSSLEEYTKQFSVDFYNLVYGLDGTDLCLQLCEMASHWEDFDENRVKRKRRTIGS